MINTESAFNDLDWSDSEAHLSLVEIINEHEKSLERSRDASLTTEFSDLTKIDKENQFKDIYQIAIEPKDKKYSDE